MEEPFSPERLAPLLNLSGAGLNRSSSSLSRQLRLSSAAGVLLLGLLGNCLVLRRLCCGRGRRRRRLDFLVGQLALADLYGCGLALLSHLTAELLGAAWPAADAPCRLLRLLQGSGLLAPSNLLVLLALERQHVVRRPPPPPPPARALAALGWLLALLLALPQAFVVRRCRSIFPRLPRWHAQAYGAYGALAGFLAPACLLGWASARLLLALGEARRPPPAAPWPLPRARARTLQLTLVLVGLFALCRLPRFLLQLALAFAPPAGLREARAALALVAVSNSALNPYAYLLFQGRRPRARCCCCCCCPEPRPRRRPKRRAPHRRRPKDRPPPGAQPPACRSPALPPGPGPAQPEAAPSACHSGL